MESVGLGVEKLLKKDIWRRRPPDEYAIAQLAHGQKRTKKLPIRCKRNLERGLVTRKSIRGLFLLINRIIYQIISVQSMQGPII